MSVLKMRAVPMGCREAVAIVVILFVVMHFMLPLSEVLHKVYEIIKFSF